MIKISVIVPIYNGENYLVKCLESLVNQTLIDIEIILINDGSTDNSLEICKNYSNKDYRIIIINKKNGGVSSARNAGIDTAKGIYITFVDSDDWIELNTLEKMYTEIEEKKADICLCNYVKEYNNGEKKFINISIKENYIQGSEIKNKVILEFIGNSKKDKNSNVINFKGPWGKLYNKSIIDKYKIRFNENLIIGEDFIFNLEFLSQIDKLVIFKGNNYNYYFNNNSIMNRYKEECWKYYRDLLENIIRFIDREKIKEDIEERVLNTLTNYIGISVINEFKGNKSTTEIIKHVNYICNDKVIIRILKNCNKSKLSLKERIKFIIIKRKLCLVIYFYYRKRFKI